MKFCELKESVLFRVRNNKGVRLIVGPYINYKRKEQKKHFCNTEDSKYIASFHNKHDGQKCFILGNGPSLTVQDLEKLKYENTFAFNRIYYMFDKTDWRPTYYMCVDVGVIGMNIHEIAKMELPNKFVSDTAKKYKIDNSCNLHYIFDYSKFKINRWSFNKPYISEDVSNHFCLCFTVTYDAIQFAIYMGFKEIYLLGVDHNYSVKADAKGRITKDESVKDYFDGLEKTAITAMNYEATTAAFASAREYCDKHGVNIYNATRGGELEEFERVDFDSLF